MSGFSKMSLDWCEANVNDAKPCPFCGGRLTVTVDRIGAWLSHAQPGECFEANAVIAGEQSLKEWNTRT